MPTTKKQSPLKRLSALLFSLLTILLAAMGVWLWNRNKADRLEDLAKTASTLQRYYENTFQQRELSLLSIGTRLLDFSGDSALADRYNFAKKALSLYDDLLAFGLADTTGQLITFTGAALPTDPLPSLVASEESKRSFLEAKKASRIVVGEVYFFDAVDSWIIPIRVPLRDEQNKLIAVNTSAVNYQTLIGELESFELHPQYTVQWVNARFNTTQIYFPLPQKDYEKWLAKPADLYPEKKVLKSKKSSHGMLHYFQGEQQLEDCKMLAISTSPGNLNHFVTVAVPYNILYHSFWQDFSPILFLYFLLMAIMLAGIRFFHHTNRNFTLQLKEERDYSNNIIRQSPNLIIRINQKQECVFLNPKAQEVTGYSLQDLKGKNYWKVLYPDELYKQVEILTSAYLNGEDISNWQMTIKTKSGQLRTIHWNSVIDFENKGKGDRIAFGVDITE